MRKAVIKFVKESKPYHSLLLMLLFYIGIFVSAYNFIISPSDLRVTIKNETISYPSSLIKNFESINSYLIRTDTLVDESISAYSFLRQTTDLKTFRLRNESSKTIKNIQFRQVNSNYLTAWSISSDFLTETEEKDLLKKLIYDKLRNVVYLNERLEIPPKSHIYIYLWGNFDDDIIGRNTLVSYDGGDGFIEESFNLTGIKGYFAKNIFEILIIVIIIFIIVYLQGIKSLKDNSNDT